MSVFSKIFISFGLALILSIVLTALVRPFKEPPHTYRETTTNVLTLYGQTLLRELSAGRTDEVVAGIRSLEQFDGIELFVLDARGNDVTGREVPGAVRLAMQEGQEEGGGSTEVPIVWRPLRDQAGRRFTLVADFTKAPRRRPTPNRTDLVTRLALLFLSSGIVCFLLAHYLTTPITRLRHATQQFANGELQVRAPAAGARKDEIALLVNDFNRMAERIETLITAQRRLITDISHELRSPLTRLSIAIGLLRQKTGPEATAMLDRLEREEERLDQLIGQLLTLSSFESGDRAVDQTKEDLDLVEIASEVAADADYEARDRNCRVRFTQESPDGWVVQGNRELLRSAIENIVRNAVRYTAEGSMVELSLFSSMVGGRSMATLRVRDHGPGIPEAELENVFRPFYRLTAARDRGSGGVGLGLAISDRAARLYGGDVKAANAPDGGLVVEFRIPVNDRISQADPVTSGDRVIG